MEHERQKLDPCTQLAIDIYYLRLSQHFSSLSNDDSTKIGAILTDYKGEVLSTGFNHYITNDTLNKPERLARPHKYKWILHAEMDAITAAARFGGSLEGSTLYISFEGIPCTECFKAIINSGITRLVGIANKPFGGKGEHWAEDLKVAEEMFFESGIDLVFININQSEESSDG